MDMAKKVNKNHTIGLELRSGSRPYLFRAMSLFVLSSPEVHIAPLALFYFPKS